MADRLMTSLVADEVSPMERLTQRTLRIYK